MKSSAHDVLHVTSSTGELTPGILPYFMDGMLPLLKVMGAVTVCNGWDGYGREAYNIGREKNSV